jgi:hypothetical protein
MLIFALFKNNIKSIFERYPILSNSTTGFITFCCGDIISQAALLNINGRINNNINNNNNNNNNNLDYKNIQDYNNICNNNDKIIINNNNYYNSNIKINFEKAFCTGLLGSLMNGIVMNVWYKGLDNIFGTSMKSTRGIFMKIISDQIIFAPFAIIVFFMNSTAYKIWRGNLFNDNINNNSYNNNNFIANLIYKLNKSFITAYKGDWTVWPIINLINFSLIPINYRPTFIACVQLGWQSWLSIITNKSNLNEELEEKKEVNINLKDDISLSRKQF